MNDLKQGNVVMNLFTLNVTYDDRSVKTFLPKDTFIIVDVVPAQGYRTYSYYELIDRNGRACRTGLVWDNDFEVMG